MRLGKDDGAGLRPQLAHRARLAVVMVVVVIAAALVLRSSATKVTAAKESAYAFVVGVRTGNRDAVRASTTARLNGAIDAIAAGVPPDRELARRLEIVRTSQAFSGTFVGSWDEGCVDGDLDGKTHLWLRLDRVGTTWRVDDLQVGAMPVECRVPVAPLREIHFGL